MSTLPWYLQYFDQQMLKNRERHIGSGLGTEFEPYIITSGLCVELFHDTILEFLNVYHSINGKDKYGDVFFLMSPLNYELWFLYVQTQKTIKLNLHLTKIESRSSVPIFGIFRASFTKIVEEETIPNEFFCPITCEIMKEPMILEDGFTYERSAIEKWLKRSILSPMTNKELSPPIIMLPNRSLKCMIQKCLENRPI